ncbi:MAG: SurA N-terminal domain-containing protein [Nitrospinota bacterium]|nr:SurA N-terminal domain-containing protein [Nitrospinota bacterium]
MAKVGADAISRSFFLQYCQLQYRLASKEEDVEDFKKFKKEEYQKFLDSLINYSLLLQDAKKRAIKPPMDKINAQIEGFKKKFGTPQELTDYLGKRRLTLDVLKNEATKNEIINIMILEVLPNIKEMMKITDKEISDFYNANKAKFNNKSLEEIKPNLANLIKGAKKRKALEEFYGKLRGQAEIEIFEDKL